jgi:GNAT superfamily N-acetyltransferase
MALPPETTEVTWARFFDPQVPVHCLAAERDGQLIDLAHYLFHRSTTTVENSCYLQDMFTAPEARGGGVGRALIVAVYKNAKAAGSSRLYWQTHETNHTAQRLYDSCAERSGVIVYRINLTQAAAVR